MTLGLLVPQAVNVLWTGGDLHFEVGSIPLLLWLWLPYGLLGGLGYLIQSRPALLLGLVSLITFNFVSMMAMKSAGSSTAALGFFVVPAVQLVAVLPAGLLVGAALGWIATFLRGRSRLER